MKTYTLHVPREAGIGDPDALDRAELVKDGFAWGAFFFTFLWFFAQRLWLAGLFVLLILVTFTFGLRALDTHPVAGFVGQLLLSILIGLEANALKRWTLGRNGRPALDVVSASDRDEAETKAFTRWLARSAQPGPIPQRSAATATPYRGPEPVIGLFPEAEQTR